MRRSHTKEPDGVEGGAPQQDGWLWCVLLISFQRREDEIWKVPSNKHALVVPMDGIESKRRDA